VIGVPDEDWGQIVVALVEPADGAAPGDDLAADLLAHCEPRLAKLKHPRRVEFRASLPRTPSGKLSRRRVREDYLGEHAGCTRPRGPREGRSGSRRRDRGTLPWVRAYNGT